MHPSRILFLLLLGLLGGCFAPTPAIPPEPIRQVPYQISLNFSSNLPELYYVMSGPGFTYGRFRVNERFSGLLRELASNQSLPGSEAAATLDVHIASLQTEFDEIGQRPAIHPGRVKVAALQPITKVASLELAADMEPGDFNLPETTYKRARLELQLRLRVGDQIVAERLIQVKHTERHDWYDESPAMLSLKRYDYGSVFEDLYRKALKEVSQFLEEVLLPKAGPGV